MSYNGTKSGLHFYGESAQPNQFANLTYAVPSGNQLCVAILNNALHVVTCTLDRFCLCEETSGYRLSKCYHLKKTIVRNSETNLLKNILKKNEYI